MDKVYQESRHGHLRGVRSHVHLLRRGDVVLGGDQHTVATEPGDGGSPCYDEGGGAHIAELDVGGGGDGYGGKSGQNETVMTLAGGIPGSNDIRDLVQVYWCFD